MFLVSRVNYLSLYLNLTILLELAAQELTVIFNLFFLLTFVLIFVLLMLLLFFERFESEGVLVLQAAELSKFSLLLVTTILWSSDHFMAIV